MYSLLFEQAWIIGAIGLVLTIVTLYGWMQTGNAIAFKTGIGMAIATLVLILMNSWVETDAEQIQTWLSDIANEVQNNEVEKVLCRIAPVHSERVAGTAERMKLVKFTVAKITRIHAIDVQYRGKEATATIRMNAIVHAEMNGTSGKVPRWVQLTLQKQGKEWKITDFEDREPQHEFMQSSHDQGVLQLP
jgi:hypothetical protein